MLLDLHTDFSGGRSGGLLFPSLLVFSVACCDPPKGFGIVNKADLFWNSCSFSQGYGFPVVMYGCDSWTIKKAQCRWIDTFEVLEKTLESPLNFKEIQPVHPKGDQSWVVIGRTDVEAETPILWPPDAKNWLIGKDPDAGKDWGHEEKGTTEDEIVGWHHRLNGMGLGGLESWWWTGRPGMLWFMGSHRVRHDWVTELNWTCCFYDLTDVVNLISGSSTFYKCNLNIRKFYWSLAWRILSITLLACEMSLIVQ